MLAGKKTYIVAIVLGIATALQTVGIITTEQYQLLAGFLASFGLMALRAGMPKA